MIDLEYSFFQRKTLELVGVDLSSYKSEQMKRRVQTIMARSGAQNLFEYYRLISEDSKKRQEFRDFITINVSEFFRIPDRFQYLRQSVLPTLLNNRRPLKVWSAGCSNGAEPYSLAILLNEVAPMGQWSILATDVDATIIEQARRGIYGSADIHNLSSAFLKKYFIAVGDQFQVIDKLKRRIRFNVHDLLRDEYEEDLDLIACRHVLIYFTDVAKDSIFTRFHRSLQPGGVLFLGGTEIIRRPLEMGYDNQTASFYRKVSG